MIKKISRQKEKEPEGSVTEEPSKVQRDSEIKELLAVHAEGKNLCQMNSMINYTDIEPGVKIKAEEFSLKALQQFPLLALKIFLCECAKRKATNLSFGE